VARRKCGARRFAGKIQYLPFIVVQLKDIRGFRSAAADTFDFATGAFLLHHRISARPASQSEFGRVASSRWLKRGFG
jgi:hypothetical protein